MPKEKNDECFEMFIIYHEFLKLIFYTHERRTVRQSFKEQVRGNREMRVESIGPDAVLASSGQMQNPPASSSVLKHIPQVDADIAATLQNLETVRNQWNQNGASWTQIIRNNMDAFRSHFLDKTFHDFIGPVQHQRILDAGCGEGQLARQLAQQGARVTGVDLSSELIAAAKELETAQKLGIHYKVGSFTDLSDFKPRSFDKITSHMAIMDSPDLPKTLKAFERVLKPHGEVIMSIKHPFSTLADLSYRLTEGNQVELSYKGSYFDKTPHEKSFGFSDAANEKVSIRTIHYPRTLSDYVNQFRQAGFGNLHFEEPFPSAEAVQAKPHLARYQHYPSVLMIRAEKLGGPWHAAGITLLNGLSILGLALGLWHITINTVEAYRQAKNNTVDAVTSKWSVFGKTAGTFVTQVIKFAASCKLAAIGFGLGSTLFLAGSWPAIVAGIGIGVVFSMGGYHLLSKLFPDPVKQRPSEFISQTS